MRVHPPYFVERISAAAAIQKYKPRVVIGAFVPEVKEDGSEPGVDEIALLKTCGYIHIGHVNLHKDKRINRIPHKSFMPEYLVSRELNWSGGIIQVWPRLKLADEKKTRKKVLISR